MKHTITAQGETYDVHVEIVHRDDEIGDPGGYEIADIYEEGKNVDIYEDLEPSTLDEIENKLIDILYGSE